MACDPKELCHHCVIEGHRFWRSCTLTALRPWQEQHTLSCITAELYMADEQRERLSCTQEAVECRGYQCCGTKLMAADKETTDAKAG